MDEQDLEQMADQEIEDMRRRMTDAARLDAAARRQGQPAMHKLKMLPEVLNLLNRNQYTASLVDPEINLLEAVKFFLEPLDDGELPAYNIQRDLMDVLGKLPINKDSLVASGIGKVIVFYTKSKRPELKIKRQAERLLADWTRPILQRSDDYSKRVYEEVEFDPTYAFSSSTHHLRTLLTCTDALSTVPISRNRLPTKLVHANCSHHVWRIVLVARWVIHRTVSFLARLWFRTTSLLGRSVLAEKIVSDE